MPWLRSPGACLGLTRTWPNWRGESCNCQDTCCLVQPGGVQLQGSQLPGPGPPNGGVLRGPEGFRVALDGSPQGRGNYPEGSSLGYPRGALGERSSLPGPNGRSGERACSLPHLAAPCCTYALRAPVRGTLHVQAHTSRAAPLRYVIPVVC